MRTIGRVIGIEDDYAWGEFEDGRTFDFPKSIFVDDYEFVLNINDEIRFTSIDTDDGEKDAILIIHDDKALLSIYEDKEDGLEIVFSSLIEKDKNKLN